MLVLRPRIGERVYVGSACVVVVDGPDSRGRMGLRVWRSGKGKPYDLRRGGGRP
jgi:hypothetical protein